MELDRQSHFGTKAARLEVSSHPKDKIFRQTRSSHFSLAVRMPALPRACLAENVVVASSSSSSSSFCLPPMLAQAGDDVWRTDDFGTTVRTEKLEKTSNGHSHREHEPCIVTG